MAHEPSTDSIGNPTCVARHRRARLLRWITLSGFAFFALAAHAAVINGGDYGGANLTPNNGDVLNGVFTNVGTFTVAAGTTVTVSPGVPLEIHAAAIVIQGLLDGSSAGFAGGIGQVYFPAPNGGATPGSGPGGGGAGNLEMSNFAGGGAGGGYGSSGGNGGQFFSFLPLAPGGPPYGTPNMPSDRAMGSGGGGGSSCCTGSVNAGGKGGAGGGSIFLEATGSITIPGSVLAAGQSGFQEGLVPPFMGGNATAAPGGGGSGGTILLVGNSVSATGTLSVRGGNGLKSTQPPCGAAKGPSGGGAGGRIKILWGSLFTTGTTDVSGGAGGPQDGCNTFEVPGGAGGAGTLFSLSTSGCMLPTPTISVVGPTSFCPGGSVTLQANETGGTPPLSYQWNLNGSPIMGETAMMYLAVAGGDYTVTVTDSTPCGATSAPTTVTVFNNPIASISPSGTVSICQGQMTTLTASPATGVTYSWSPGGETTPSIMVGSAGMYTVTVTDGNGCFDTSPSTTVVVNPSPSVMLVGSPTTLCQNGSFTLTATASGGSGMFTNYQFFQGATPVQNGATSTYTKSNAQPGDSGTYTVVVTDSATCVSPASNGVDITVRALPSAAITTPSAVCAGSTGNAASVPMFTIPAGRRPLNGGGYVWSVTGGTLESGQGTNAITYTAGTSGPIVINVMVTDSFGCVNSGMASVTVNPLPDATITAPTEVCGGSPNNTASVPDAGAGATYAWSIATDSGTITSTPPYGRTIAFTAGDGLPPHPDHVLLFVTVTDANGCSSTGAASALIDPSPTVTITHITPTTFCQGGTVTLHANPAGGTPIVPPPPYTYQWSNQGGPIAGATTPDLNVSATGTYTITVTDGKGCTGTASQAVTVNPNPDATISASPGATVCAGTPVTLTAAQMGASYVWSPGGQITRSIVVTTTGDYSVRVTDSNGCISDSGPFHVQVNPNPTVSLMGSPTTLCQNGSFTLTATASGGSGTFTNYQFFRGATPVQSGPSNVYTNASAQPGDSGTYTVVVTDSAPCISPASNGVAVTVDPNPTVALMGGPTTLCQNGSFTLTATPSGGSGTYTNFQFFRGATSVQSGPSSTYANANAQPGDSGTYTVVVTDSATCASAASNGIGITVNPNPTVTLMGSPTTLCQNGSFTLTATASGGSGTFTNYQFFQGATSVQNGAMSTYTKANAQPGDSGSYTVVVTDSATCVSAASSGVTITVNPNPTVTLMGSPTTLCQNQSFTLTATASGGSGAFTNYQFFQGAVSVQNGPSSTYTKTNAQPADSGSYTVVVTDSATCVSAASSAVGITVNALPSATITTPSAVCAGTMGNIASVPMFLVPAGRRPLIPGGGYSWTVTGGTLTSGQGTNSITYDAGASGPIVISVTVTDNNGCVNSGMASVTVNPLPDATITAATELCASSPNNSASVPDAGAGATYAWAIATDSGTITSTPPYGRTISFTAGDGVTPHPDHVLLSITVTDANGCSSSSMVSIAINPTPVVTVTGSPTTFCEGGSVTLHGSVTGGTPGMPPAPPYTYQWSDQGGPIAGATTVDYSAIATGLYTLTATDAKGCTGSDSRMVTVNPLPVASITASPSTVVCAGTPVLLTAHPDTGVNYLWSTGASTQSIPVTATGAYSVRVTNAATGCFAMTQISVTVNPNPSVTLMGSPTALCQNGSFTLTAIASGGSGTYTNYQFFQGATPVQSGPSSTYTKSLAQPADSGSYTVVVIDSATCFSPASGVVSITVNPNPSVTLMGSPTTLCQNGSFTLTATATGGSGVYANFQFFRGATSVQSGPSNVFTNASAQPGDSGTYTVVATDSATCASPASTGVGITVNANPTVTLMGSPTTLCQNGSFTLTATASGGSGTFTNYQFFQGATSVQNGASGTYTKVNAQPGDSGSYTVVVTDSATCVSSASTGVAIAVNANPAVTLMGSPATLCQNGSFTLTATASGGSGTFANYQFFQGATSVQSGPSSTYTKSNAQPADSGSYTVVVTDSAPCTSPSSNGVTVTVNPNPSVTLMGGPTTFCQGGSFTLTATASGGSGTYTSYQFFRGATSVQNGPSGTYTKTNAQPGDSGTYTAVVTDSATCASPASSGVAVTVNPNPTVSLMRSPTTLCQNGSFTLTATASSGSGTYTNYQFFRGATSVQNGASSTYTKTNAQPGDSGSYTVVVTDSATCVSGALAGLVITVNPGPAVTLMGSPTTLCQNGSFTLTATPSSGTGAYTNYQFFRGATPVQSGPSNTYTKANAQPGDTGTYTVVVTDSRPCVSAASGVVPVTVNALPTSAITPGGPTTFCQGGSVTLTASSAVSYLWSPGGETTQAITVSAAGSYSVTVTDANGCSKASAPTTVTVNPVPATPSAANDGPICEGMTLNLSTPAVSGATYAWTGPNSFSSAQQNPVVLNTTSADAGTYMVTVTVNGCTSQPGSTTVTFNPDSTLPVVTAPADATVTQTLCQ